MIYIFITKIIKKVEQLLFIPKLRSYEYQTKQKINFVAQPNHNLHLCGNLRNFKIAETSHLKSDTFIECSGGVKIEGYFHPGRALTIWSTNHNYKKPEKLPYDEISVNKPVLIKRFVWAGSNVTIVPGSTVGEGVVIGAGSVVSGTIPDYVVIAGNPAKIISQRDKKWAESLRQKGKYF